MRTPSNHGTPISQDMAAAEAESLQLTGLAFDDQPLDSLLGAQPGPDPTPASPFAASSHALAAIKRATSDQDDTAQALRTAAALFRDGTAVPASAVKDLIVLLRPLIPNVPRPIVVDNGVDYESILDPCYRIAGRGSHPSLTEVSGTLLYRWYESGGHYAEARRIIGELMARARQRRNLLETAVLTNNLGYEYLLEADWPRAEPCFVRAAALFAGIAMPIEVGNTAANRLLCDYALDPDASRDRCERQARELLATLGKDWRRRKPLILLARIEEQRGQLDAAVSLAQQAIEAFEGVASQHRLEDQAYRDALLARCGADRPRDDGP